MPFTAVLPPSNDSRPIKHDDQPAGDHRPYLYLTDADTAKVVRAKSPNCRFSSVELGANRV